MSDSSNKNPRNVIILFLILVSLVLLVYGFVQQSKTGEFSIPLLIVGGIGLVVAAALSITGRRPE